MWVRPTSLRRDFVEGYTHIVGHTAVKRIEVKQNMVLIDCIGVQYPTIEDGLLNIHNSSFKKS